jgi:predicted N-formylglutamate amidohydrolase
MDEAAYEEWNGGKAARLLFLCDHASNKVPESLGDLGLTPSEFARHIAYDIGAAPLTKRLATRFDAPAILGRWSRLVVDLNRGADDPTVVMRLSDGRIVPGNRDIDDSGIRERIARYHAPYHRAIALRIAQAREQGLVPVLISMHSFTPVWRGVARPWELGVLWDTDERLAHPLLARFCEAGFVTGDNEPYTGALEHDCLYRHGTLNGLPHVLIETRQDLIADDAGVARMAERIGACLSGALSEMGPPAIRVPH